MSRLENWRINQFVDRLEGYIYDDPRFKDGSFVYTSRIQEFIGLENEVPLKVRTRNTIYILGKKEE